MNKLLVALVGALLAGSVVAANEELINTTGGLNSERGATALNQEAKPELLKNYRKQNGVYDRDFVHQPPLVPHDVRGYQVDKNVNKCLSCHSFKNATRMKATKISPTHFMTRDGQVLGDVSPLRYFCLQCHVPQADTKPLVGSQFKPVDALK
ncbi:MAG: nitrate reductase cytochrome c-type subunit [Aeromonas sp.]